MGAKKKKKNNKKKRAQRNHAQQRCLERKGVEFTSKMERDMLSIIQTHRSTDREFVMKQSCRISVFDVFYDDAIFRVVYDKMRKQIVTFLPENEDVIFVTDEDMLRG
jgi:hypothetical protein